MFERLACSGEVREDGGRSALVGFCLGEGRGFIFGEEGRGLSEWVVTQV